MEEEVRKARLSTEAALVHDGLFLLSEAAGSSAASRSMTGGVVGISYGVMESPKSGH